MLLDFQWVLLCLPFQLCDYSEGWAPAEFSDGSQGLGYLTCHSTLVMNEYMVL